MNANLMIIEGIVNDYYKQGSSLKYTCNYYNNKKVISIDGGCYIILSKSFNIYLFM